MEYGGKLIAICVNTVRIRNNGTLVSFNFIHIGKLTTAKNSLLLKNSPEKSNTLAKIHHLENTHHHLKHFLFLRKW